MFGLGLPEIIILLLVFGGLVFALRRRPAARKWIVGGLLVVLVCGVALSRVWHLEQLEEARRPVANAELRQRAARLGHFHQPDELSVPISSRMGRAGREGGSVVAPKPLPDWTTTAGGREYFQVVVGSQFASRQDAFADALDKAANVVSEKFRQSHPVGRWRPDGSDVDTHAVREKYTEEIIRTAGENDFTVYRTYLLIDVSPGVLSELESIWRTETMALHRSQVLIVVAILTGIAALLAGFFRLDDRTNGRYRWPLVGATAVGIALLAAVPVLAGDCIERYQQRHSMPEIEPQEAPRDIRVVPPNNEPSEVPRRWIDVVHPSPAPDCIVY